MGFSASWKSPIAFRGPPAKRRPPQPPRAGHDRYARTAPVPAPALMSRNVCQQDTTLRSRHAFPRLPQGRFSCPSLHPTSARPARLSVWGLFCSREFSQIFRAIRLDQSRLCLLLSRLRRGLLTAVLLTAWRENRAKTIIGKCRSQLNNDSTPKYVPLKYFTATSCLQHPDLKRQPFSCYRERATDTTLIYASTSIIPHKKQTSHLFREKFVSSATKYES